MNFFEQQDHAHRESKKLIFLFILAVIAIVITINLSLALLWQWYSAGQPGGGRLPAGFYLMTSVAVLLCIGAGTAFEMFRLRDGGDAVAQMAGGRLVAPDSRDMHERRLLNVVEEMSLAAGIACPNVYLLDEEDAINAFAAGYHQNEAVVAVTRGTLHRLTRDELQGVVAHEFSHILNGDMRMNIQLIGVLFGIQMLALFGRGLIEWGARFGGSRNRDDKGPPIGLVMLAAGVVLFVLGYLGIFFGRLIQSAVSRQREFLADASAVQFTRNPQGIGGALQKIGGLTEETGCGSAIQSQRAEQLSHLFLGAARPNFLSGLFATHPPLEERLQRVYGRQVRFVQAEELNDNEFSDTPAAASGFAAAASAPVSASTSAFPSGGNQDVQWGHHRNAATASGTAFPQAAASATDDMSLLQSACREPQSARALMCALLLDVTQLQAYQLQWQYIQQAAPELATQVKTLQIALANSGNSARLHWIDLAMPALKSCSEQQKASLLQLVAQLTGADGKLSENEFVLQTVLERRLSPNAARAVKVRYADLTMLKAETVLLISLLLSGSASQRAQGFAAASAVLPALRLQPTDLRVFAQPGQLDYQEVRQALVQLNQLAPLAKPLLIRAMLAAAQAQQGLDDQRQQELLRGVCAAIDVPIPDLHSMRDTLQH
ncbi:M48 family metallopeptidase [Undibacterium rugosum]|uniref:M48 family metallopeptidase n=1 Tax=Undibacterium rugosum TaxID=2762291 RepID=UPI001B83ED84|nr:M48 family metallopeptidase [Undibacterium rugosum]MBR7779661.1 M48 family metallopeptidase [Undibacterium rugosum]